MNWMQSVWGPEGCCACCALPTRRQYGQQKQFLLLYFLTMRVVRHWVQPSHLKRQHGSLLAHKVSFHVKRQLFFFLAHEKSICLQDMQMATSNSELFVLFLHADPRYPACISGVQASLQDHWEEGQREEREKWTDKRRRRRSSGEKRRHSGS